LLLSAPNITCIRTLPESGCEGPIVQFPCVTEATLVRLVDAFYDKVRADPVRGPVFDKAIGAEGWPAHLTKMYAFWSSVMLTTGRYKGNPMAAHMAVQGIEEPMFKRWLMLFGETADEFFAEAPAAIFASKRRGSRRAASSACSSVRRSRTEIG
jgi:hemoglobin